MKKRRYFLNPDCDLELDDNPTVQVLMTTPEKLLKTSADDIWKRIISCFGKYEVEYWIAEEIVSISMKAAAEGKKYADFSVISQATVCYYYKDNKEIVTNEKTFFKAFCHLPIFKIREVSVSGREVILEFVSKMP